MTVVKGIFFIILLLPFAITCLEIDFLENYHEDVIIQLQSNGTTPKGIYNRQACLDKYIIKEGNVHFEFPIQGKPTRLDRSLGAIIEICASELYHLYLAEHPNVRTFSVPHRLILNQNKTEVYVGSKYLPNFTDWNFFASRDDPPLSHEGRVHGKNMRGMTYTLTIALFLGEVDFNPGNYGFIDLKEELLFIKVDHGHSLEFHAYLEGALPGPPLYQFKGFSNPEYAGPPVNIAELVRDWNRLIPAISIALLDINEFESALHRIAQVTPEELKKIIDSCKIHERLNLPLLTIENEYQKFDHFYEVLIQRRNRVVQQLSKTRLFTASG